MNKLDPFEEALRSSIDGFEVPYNSSDWENLSNILDDKPKAAFAGGWKYAAVVAGALLLSGVAYVALNQGNGQPNAGSVAQVETPAIVEEATPDATPSNPSGQVSNQAQYQTSDNEQVLNSVAEDNVTEAIEGKHTIDSGTKEQPQQVVVEQRKQAAGNGEIGAPNNPSGGETNAKAVIPAVPMPAGASPFAANFNTSCPGNAISFQLEKVDANVIYLWNFGDGNFSNKPEPEHTYKKAGSYQVTLSMTPVSGGQIQSKQATDNIKIYDTPAAEFTFINRNEPGKLAYYHFENNSVSASEWLWDFGDGTTSTSSHPDHIYKAAGVYDVKLLIKNGAGCEDQLIRKVEVKEGNVLNALQTFSPNNDGVKDVFMPESLVSLKGAFSLSIFSTGGELVFKSNTVNDPWRGNSSTGQVLAAGEYVWVVDIEEGPQAGSSFQGTIDLIR